MYLGDMKNDDVAALQQNAERACSSGAKTWAKPISAFWQILKLGKALMDENFLLEASLLKGLVRKESWKKEYEM